MIIVSYQFLKIMCYLLEHSWIISSSCVFCFVIYRRNNVNTQLQSKSMVLSKR